VVVHITFAIVCLICVFYHIKPLNHSGQLADFIYCVYASATFWCFDRIIRHFRILYLNFSFKANGTFALPVGTVSFLPDIEDGRTRILFIELGLCGRAAERIRKSPLLKTAGRSVQLWVPGIQPHASHPFSIADVIQKPNSVLLQIYARVHKGMTGRLARKVEQAGGSIELSMLIEGFYGEELHVWRSKDANIRSADLFAVLAAQIRKSDHLGWRDRHYTLLTVPEECNTAAAGSASYLGDSGLM